MLPSHHKAFDYSRADWHGFPDHLRDVPWNEIYKYGASRAASEFSEWLQVGIDTHIIPIVNIRSNLTHLPGFHLLVPQLVHIEINQRQIRLVLRLCLGKLVIIVKGLLNLLRMTMLRRQRNPLFLREGWLS